MDVPFGASRIFRSHQKACKAAIYQAGMSSRWEPRAGESYNDGVPPMRVIWR